MTFSWQAFAVDALKAALIADEAYAATQAPGASAATLLQPPTFNALVAQLATLSAPVAPATTASPATLAASAPANVPAQ